MSNYYRAMNEDFGNNTESKGEKMINKVTKKDVMRAMEYFFVEGFIDELTIDKKYYTKILLNNAANQYGIKLEWEEK